MIRSQDNPYPGVNAHLHSLWQSRGGWHEFHSLYLANLYTEIKPRLLEMGYTAALESSMSTRCAQSAQSGQRDINLVTRHSLPLNTAGAAAPGSPR